ncbi:GerAB/ArcD/ProY family transporter [Syntrophomonas erecta]
MDRTRFEFTSKQLIFFIVGSQVAGGIFSLPRLVAAEAGHNAWLAVIAGVIPSMLSILIICSLFKRWPDPDFVNLNHRLFGKIIGSGLVIIFVLYIILFESITLRIFSEITSIFMLPTTPMWFVVLVVTLSVLYAMSKGGKVVACLNEFLFYILLLSLLVVIVPAFSGDYLNLLPLQEITPGGVFQGAVKSSFAFAGIEVLLVVYALVPRRGEILKAALIGQSFVVFFYVMVTIISLAVFGLDFIDEIVWPVLALLKVTEIPILQRLEFFFLILWIALGVRPALNLGFAAAYASTRLFNLDFNRFYGWVVLLLGLLIYIGALQPGSLPEAFQWAGYAGTAFLVVALGYPLLYYLATLLKGGITSDDS